ncbi:MAG: ABC transporter permease [Chloroflexota bacterium]|nr:ABC transporter permease [Chloroflexota bacterium]
MSLLAGLRARTLSAPGARRRRRAEPDWTLLAGLGALLALLALALYGPLVAPHDFYFTQSLLDGKPPPFPPSPRFPLGTDDTGHDLLSWVLIGARSTLVMATGAAALRMAIGGFLGTFAGWQGGWKEAVLTRAALSFSSVPATVLAVLGVLAFNVYSGPLGCAVALGLLGWGDAFHHARRHARAEGAKAFIESARSQGMTETRVVLRHLVPGIAPSLLTLGALQVSAVLLLLGEIGLLRIFIGGAEVVEFDQRFGGPSIVLATHPDWGSMLAATRPIFSLYGAAWTVLVPGLALLGAVIGTNLLGDGLARRAQQLDVYRLLRPGQSVALCVICAALVLPTLLWPSRLADDLTYGERATGAVALATGRALADPSFAGRVAGSPGAIAAADVIGERWVGTVRRFAASVTSIAGASVTVGATTISEGPDLSGLSLLNGSAAGLLRELDRSPVTSFKPGSFAGQVLVTSPKSRFGALPFVASQGGAVGVIIVDDDIGGYTPSTQQTVPTVRISTAAFRALTGTLPMSLDAAATTLPTGEVRIAVAVSEHAYPSANVIAAVQGASDSAPLILVLMPFDAASYPHYLALKPTWDTASAVGVAAEALVQLRAAPVAAAVRFVAVGADSLGGAGVAAYLSTLDRGDAARMVAAVRLGSVQSGAPSVEVEQSNRANPGDATPGGRVGGRVADALGLRTRPVASPLRDMLRSAGASASVFGLNDQQGAVPGEPSAEALRAATRDLLTLLSYISRHPEELR